MGGGGGGWCGFFFNDTATTEIYTLSLHDALPISNLDDTLPSDWFAKLGENRECFNLLGGGNRFCQYGGSEIAKSKKLAANYLLHEIPTGTNKWHFRHATDKVDGLCPACCAIGLLRLPLFATSGGRGKPPGINLKPPLYVMPARTSLAATLRLSWLHVADVGNPVWAMACSQLPETGDIPLLLGLTWLPRRVWLENPEKPEANCISCGRASRLIRRCVFAGIGSQKSKDGGPEQHWRDPHVIYESKSDGKIASLHARDATDLPDAAAGQWSGIVKNLMVGKVMRDTRAALVASFSSTKNDKYLEANEYLIDLPVSSMKPSDCSPRVGEWAKNTAWWERQLMRLKKGKKPRNRDWRFWLEGRLKKTMPRAADISRFVGVAISAVRPHVESKTSARLTELLSGGDSAWEKATHEYRLMMEIIAKSFSPGFTTVAVERRRRIAAIAPDMRPRTKSDRSEEHTSELQSH